MLLTFWNPPSPRLTNVLGELNMMTSKDTFAPNLALKLVPDTRWKPEPVSEYPTLHTTTLYPGRRV